MGFDNVVYKILNHVLTVTEIDPSAIEPDHRLIEDLGMSNKQFDCFLSEVRKDFRLREGFAVEQRHNMSLRRFVSLVKSELQEIDPHITDKVEAA